MNQAPDENLVIGQRTQEKLEFYVIALTFTVLGLSIQTAAFGQSVFADVLEIVSWGALLVSGLVGLWRIEGKPHTYNLFALKSEYETRAQGIRKAEVQGVRFITSLEDGKEYPLDQALSNAVTSVSIIEEKLSPLERSLGARYRWQRRLFVTGFVCLALARAFIPVSGVVDKVRYMVTQ